MSSSSSPVRTPAGGTSSPAGARLHTVYLVRHGQSTWNTQRRIQGQTPHVPLTALGVSQAERVANALRGSGVIALFTSDLLRAEQTADVLGRALGLRARRTPALREQGLGTYEGQLVAEIPRAELDRVAELGADGRMGGGETVREVYERVGILLQDLVENETGPIVLVSHGDTIRVASAWLQGLAPEDVPPHVPANGSITVVELCDGRTVRVAVDVPPG